MYVHNCLLAKSACSLKSNVYAPQYCWWHQAISIPKCPYTETEQVLGCVVWRIHRSPGRRLLVSAVPFIPSILLTVLSGFCDSRKEGRRRHICMCSGHRRHITVSRSKSGGAMNPGLATHTINSKFADSGCLWRCVPRLSIHFFSATSVQ